MEINKNKIEIMAPVGSYESLRGAIQGGASSVYFGVGRLNMRARSSVNFTIEDLRKITEICDENNVRSYLTVNTVIYNHELEEMRSIIDAAKESGISAIIASDISVIIYARSLDMEVHISTQQNVTNIEALRYFAQFADVIVLARELRIDQIADLVHKVKEFNITGPSGNLVQIEIFVHGALCMAVSGKCYMSLHENNHSANRGACLQTCRRRYKVTDIETGHELEIDNEYIMSPKDLCTIEFLDRILDAGVTVLKIEGRGRAADYVKKVCRVYKEIVDDYQRGEFSPEKAKGKEEELATVFNRGFWGGYYQGKLTGEWTTRYGSRATKRKLHIGRGVKYFRKLKVGVFDILSHDLKVGDDILITGPTSGVIETKVKEIRVEREIVEKAVKGDECSIQIDEPIRPSDKLFKIIDAEAARQQ